MRDADSVLISGLIGSSPPMLEVYRITRKVAPTAATVLLTGETGTGKELIARALHELSPSRNGAVHSSELRSVVREPPGK